MSSIRLITRTGKVGFSPVRGSTEDALLGQQIAQSRVFIELGFESKLGVHLIPEPIGVSLCRLHRLGILGSLALVDGVIKPPMRGVTCCNQRSNTAITYQFVQWLGSPYIVVFQLATTLGSFVFNDGGPGLEKGDLVSAFGHDRQVCNHTGYPWGMRVKHMARPVSCVPIHP